MMVFEEYESRVRSYCRSFPTIFVKAKGHRMWDQEGKSYLDFFAGAGALNYGHNHDGMKKALLEYIENDGVTHSLDMMTEAKETFLKKFHDVILEPRSMYYKVQFPGPTGTNAVEAALKLARKITGRNTIMGFTNAFHGMTLGSLSVTGNAFKRMGAGVPLGNTIAMPYSGFLGRNADTIDYIEHFLVGDGTGIDEPAAVIVETLQGEGGLNSATARWLQGVQELCRAHGMLLIVDDIQVGCGRTGTFFSFEPYGIKPDIITLSKSLSGYGLPLALTLIKPEIDLWEPGEHNGTFRGNNPAFVTAVEALKYWEDDSFSQEIIRKGEKMRDFLISISRRYLPGRSQVRGRGMLQGIACDQEELAGRICREAFERGLLMETSGPNDEVAKMLPSLTITDEELDEGFEIFEEAVRAAVEKFQTRRPHIEAS